MKTIALALSILFLTLDSQAGGFNCSGQCIAVDSPNFQVYTLGNVGYRGALPQYLAYQDMVNQCQTRASAHGLIGTVVDDVSWSASHKTENTSFSTHTSSGSANLAVAAQRGWFRQRAIGMGSASSHSSSTAYQQNRDESTLNINRLVAATVDSCKPDSQIQDHELPYTGDLEVQN